MRWLGLSASRQLPDVRHESINRRQPQHPRRSWRVSGSTHACRRACAFGNTCKCACACVSDLSAEGHVGANGALIHDNAVEPGLLEAPPEVGLGVKLHLLALQLVYHLRRKEIKGENRGSALSTDLCTAHTVCSRLFPISDPPNLWHELRLEVVLHGQVDPYDGPGDGLVDRCRPKHRGTHPGGGGKGKSRSGMTVRTWAGPGENRPRSHAHAHAPSFPSSHLLWLLLPRVLFLRPLLPCSSRPLLPLSLLLLTISPDFPFPYRLLQSRLSNCPKTPLAPAPRHTLPLPRTPLRHSHPHLFLGRLGEERHELECPGFLGARGLSQVCLLGSESGK